MVANAHVHAKLPPHHRPRLDSRHEGFKRADVGDVDLQESLVCRHFNMRRVAVYVLDTVAFPYEVD